jgi:hypothetical protein
MRLMRVLVRRHGPTSLVWRRRLAMGSGAVLVGVVALLFAEMAMRRSTFSSGTWRQSGGCR